MSHNVTITDPHQPDAMPMWESIDHDTTEDACRAAQAHIDAAQPDDRIVDETRGTYSVWTGASDQALRHVATIVITPTDDLDADPAPGTQEADHS